MRPIALLVVLLALPAAAAAQWRILPPPVRLADTVRAPTLVYLYDGRFYNGLSRNEHAAHARVVDSVTAVLREIAEAEGFRFALHSSGLVRLEDSLGRSLFTPRPDVITGVVLVAPGRAAQWIPQLPAARELPAILRDYAAGRYRLFTQPARNGAA